MDMEDCTNCIFILFDPAERSKINPQNYDELENDAGNGIASLVVVIFLFKL